MSKLSKLQKAILLLAWDADSYGVEHWKVSERFYKTLNASNKQLAAISRAAARLEERGLIRRVRGGGSHRNSARIILLPPQTELFAIHVVRRPPVSGVGAPVRPRTRRRVRRRSSVSVQESFL
jgi:hypothetical protein